MYGYLRPDLKALVNQIVDELAKDERIAQLYDLWYQDKQAVRNVYDERPLERVPLSENTDFKPIRNAVVRAAVELDVEQRQTQNQNYAPPLLTMATRLLRQAPGCCARWGRFLDSNSRSIRPWSGWWTPNSAGRSPRRNWPTGRN